MITINKEYQFAATSAIPNIVYAFLPCKARWFVALFNSVEAEAKFYDLECPYCGDTVSFPEDTQLKVQECPNCLETIIIPDEPGPVAKKVPLPIATPRLLLRRFVRSDSTDVLEFFGDEQLFEYVQAGPMTSEQAADFLEKDSYKKLTSPNTWFCLAVQDRETEKVIGEVRWHLWEDRSGAVADICVNRNFQRQGFGTEALRASLGFCFNVLGFRRIVLMCDTRNTGAIRMAEKAHMRREAQFIKDRFLNGEWASTFQYAMLAEEFADADSR